VSQRAGAAEMTNTDDELKSHPLCGPFSKRRDRSAVGAQTGQPIAEGAPLVATTVT
jgi:hypothetical protein